MKVLRRITVPTGDILVVEGSRGRLELLSLGPRRTETEYLKDRLAALYAFLDASPNIEDATICPATAEAMRVTLQDYLRYFEEVVEGKPPSLIQRPQEHTGSASTEPPDPPSSS